MKVKYLYAEVRTFYYFHLFVREYVVGVWWPDLIKYMTNVVGQMFLTVYFLCNKKDSPSWHKNASLHGIQESWKPGDQFTNGN